MVDLFSRRPLATLAGAPIASWRDASTVPASLRDAASRRKRSSHRRGLTLVEMLIAMAITLLMMGGVVTVFANISGSVRDRRAMIELGGQLRSVREQLNRDLQGATCDGRTWQRPDEGNGYIEIVEGPRTDYDPSAFLIPGLNADPTLYPASTTLNPDAPRFPAESLVPGSQLNQDAQDEFIASDGSALGDWDDVLGLTVRNMAEPFRGRGPNPTLIAGTPVTLGRMETRIIESDLAEVIWFAAEEGSMPLPDFPTPRPNESPRPDPDPGNSGMRQVFRRVLVIAPWVDLSRVGPLSAPQFFQRYDISAHWDPVAPRTNPNGTQSPGRWVANTLGDLTKREYRYYHDATNLLSGSNPLVPQSRTFPHVMVRPEPLVNIASAVNPATGNLDPNRAQTSARYTPVLVSLADFSLAEAFPGAAGGLQLDPGSSAQGQDRVLGDALAFDVRVYDPGAPLIELNGTSLQPGDRGWHLRAASGTTAFGYGAYVDLGWNFNWNLTQPYSRNEKFFPLGGSNDPLYDLLPGKSGSTGQSWTDVGTPPMALFANPPANEYLLGLASSSTSLPAAAQPFPYSSAVVPSITYDTWSFHYERDGINQDQDFVLKGPPIAQYIDPSTNNPVPLVDEGTNGFDDIVPNPINPNVPMENGVDDAGERETHPPYDVPLQGIQVRLRVYERDARQIREATAVRSFVP